MNIKIFPSETAGDMPVVSKLPGCIQLKYHAILVVISGCANKTKCLILEKSLCIIFFNGESLVFLIDGEGCDK